MTGALQPGEPRVALRARQQLVAAGNLFDLERGAVGVVEALQPLNESARFGGVGQPGDLTELAGGERFVGHQECRFEAGEGAVAGVRVERRRLWRVGVYP